MIDELVRRHGSPLWLADLDRVGANLGLFRATWAHVWPDVHVAYSYKTNRLPAILRTVAAAGATPEVVCEAEYLLAREVAGADGASIIVNGPAKPGSLLERAAIDGALVIVDSIEELDRAAARGVDRVGMRVALDGIGAEPTRFGIPPERIPDAVWRAEGLGQQVEVLHGHVVSTGFTKRPGAEDRLAASIAVAWPPSPDRHVAAARILGELARDLGVPAVDLGGGHPGHEALIPHAEAVGRALALSGFTGRVILEPGRAIVSDAVDLVLSVLAVKRLADGTRCVIVDGGTNLLPATLWGWPRLEAVADLDEREGAEPALVTGPLCLNVDVLHPAADLPELVPGDLVVARGAGAYQQAQSTQFGDLRPAVAARTDGVWRLVTRRETIGDVIAGDLAETLAAGALTPQEDP